MIVVNVIGVERKSTTTAKRVQSTIFTIVVRTVGIVKNISTAMSVQFTILMIVVNVIGVKNTSTVRDVFDITNEFMLNALVEIKISTV